MNKNEAAFVWNMARRRRLNPLRNRNTLTAVDLAACRAKAHEHIVRRKLLKEYDVKLKHTR